MPLCGYDIIGDIHGRAETLINLLIKLGYSMSETGYSHPSRKVIFLGDFIDRGEELRQHKQLMSLVIPMVENNHALAIMGNHEYNAIAYHTLNNGEYLREHSPKNADQHRAFLNEYDDDPVAKDGVLEFFYSLPLFLEIDGIRCVHACWQQQHIDYVKKQLPGQLVTKAFMIDSSKHGSTPFEAIETLLKGFAIALPEGVSFNDKSGDERFHIRTRWWEKNATVLADIVLPEGLDLGDAATQPIPTGIPFYKEDDPICFVGHYWLKGRPRLQANNLACLDYSAGKGGTLVAYRWDIGSELSDANYCWNE